MLLSSELLSALLGALVGGSATIAGSFLSMRASLRAMEKRLSHEKDLRSADILRSRGEELYGLIEAWSRGAISNYLPLLNVMQGEMEYNTYLDLSINKSLIPDTTVIGLKCFLSTFLLSSHIGKR